jgi:hypothetical protein
VDHPAVVTGLALGGAGRSLEDQNPQGSIPRQQGSGGCHAHDPGADHDDVVAI